MNSGGRSNRGRIQTNVHSIVLYSDSNNDNGPVKYGYCRLHTDPDFVLYHSLMSIAYSGCDENNFVYKACHYEQKIFNTRILAISNNLSCAFDTICPCAIYGKVGHIFERCEELQDYILIQKSYIQFCVALQKIKGMEVNQN